MYNPNSLANNSQVPEFKRAMKGGNTMAISINLYLDQRFANQVVHPEEQEFPVKVTITKDGATAYLPTG